MSAYRLTIHLALAIVLYGAIVWAGLSVLRPLQLPVPSLRRLSKTCLAVLSLTILAGGFVAGLRAGLDYNTFPLMDGRLVPSGYAALDPFVRNLTENIAAVQFNHRVLATLTLLLVTATAIAGLQTPGVRHALRWRLLLLAGTVILQYGLGVATLLMVVPIGLGTAHQVGATVLLTALLIVIHATSARPTAGRGR